MTRTFIGAILPCLQHRLRSSQQFDRHGGGLAAADAQRGDAALLAALAQRAEQRDDDARAAGADRVAERDRRRRGR